MDWWFYILFLLYPASLDPLLFKESAVSAGTRPREGERDRILRKSIKLFPSPIVGKNIFDKKTWITEVQWMVV